jgi:heme a synthase
VTDARAPTIAMPAARGRIIAAWLFAVAAMVFAMIVLGGVTRLTQSGLSITEWWPISGWLPPLGDAAWAEMFDRYRTSPEYHMRNVGMTLDDYKTIFWFEYAHRLWGRIIGVAFLVPMVAFMAKGWVTRPLAARLVGLFVLGGAQGALGWYMVMSGLVNQPDVSPYRLAAHLGLGVAIFAALEWTALDLLRPGATAGDPAAGRMAPGALALVALVFVTQLSGAFVAGLDAGFTYNTFPLMDGQWLPAEMFVLRPLYVNFFENIATVQFDHRLLAMAVLIATAWFWWRARPAPLTAEQRLAVNATAIVAAAQVGLGIATLLLVVPVAVAALHQAGSVALLGAGVWAAHALKRG